MEGAALGMGRNFTWQPAPKGPFGLYEKVMTGMTRDGLFLVENGKVARAAKNFRFNQSVLEMLRNV